MKIAKVAVTNVLLWYITWSPYAVVVAIGQWGNRSTLTPFIAQVTKYIKLSGLDIIYMTCI